MMESPLPEQSLSSHRLHRKCIRHDLMQIFFRAVVDPAACTEGQAILTRHEAVSAWLARMQARPSMVNTGWDRLAAIAA